MTADSHRRVARIAGFATGLVLVAAVAWHAFRVSPSEAPLGLDVALRAAASGEFAVDPVGTDVIKTSGLLAGQEHDAARGLLHVRNVTGRTVAARPRLEGGDPALDSVLHLELTRRGERVFRGPAGALRAGRARGALTVPAGDLAGLRVRAYVPESVDQTRLGGGGDWTLSFDAEVVR